MGRLIPPEKKTRIVLAILAGEMSIAEAVRKEKVSEQSIGRWKAESIEACRTARSWRVGRGRQAGRSSWRRGRGVDPGAR
jgi:Ni/Co efflux regulator RcnB